MLLCSRRSFFGSDLREIVSHGGADNKRTWGLGSTLLQRPEGWVSKYNELGYRKRQARLL
jgi:hypothetical protein